MAIGGYVYTYPDVARRESLLDAMNMLEPIDTQLLSGIMQGPATNTLHEWTIDTLEAVGDNAQPEGGDAPADASNDPTRPQNLTQILSKTAKITGTELAVKRVSGNRMAREMTKKLKALKNDTELALIRGTIASGAASNTAANARRMRGVKSWITTNTSNYSGATFTETVMNDMFEAQWNQGAQADSVYTSMKGKRRVAGFTAGATKQVDLKDRRLINAVDVYESDAAKMVKLFPHRHVTRSGDYGTTATPAFDVLSLQEDTWGTAFLRRPFTKQLAETGDFEAKQIIHELTLESRNQLANAQGVVFF